MAPRNNQRVSEGRMAGGWVSPGPGIEEDTGFNEHWGFSANHESLNAASKTNDVLDGG